MDFFVILLRKNRLRFSCEQDMEDDSPLKGHFWFPSDEKNCFDQLPEPSHTNRVENGTLVSRCAY